MEIRQLEYFLMVSKVNSFTRAAELLYVSQPAVTNAVRTLEDELGIRLIDRSLKQATLTTEGKIFYAHVEKLMQGISNTLNEINALKDLNGGVLRLGSTAFGDTISSMQLIKNFIGSYPNIRISIREDSTENLQKMLIEDAIDAAIVFDGLELGTLTYINLSREELVVCCSRQHKFRRRNSIPIDELHDEKLILIGNDSVYRRKIGNAFSTAGISPRVVYESSRVQTAKQLAADDCGITTLPESLCEFDQNLATVALEPPIFLQTLAAYKTNRHQSHAAAAILNLAKEMSSSE